MGDAQQQTMMVAGMIVFALVDIVLLLVWGYRRFVRNEPTFAPRWSVVDVWVGVHLIGALLVLLLVPLMAVLFALPGVRVENLTNFAKPEALLYLALPGTILQNVACFLVPAGYIWFKYGQRLRDIGLPPRPSRRDVTAGILLGLAGLVVAQGLGLGLHALARHFDDIEFVRKMLEYEKNNPVAQITKMLPTFGIPGLLLAVLTIGISAPVGEEMLFRGFAMNALTRRFGATAGLVGSSLLFAAPHTYSPLGQSVVFLLGLAMAWTYRNSGSLWVPILFHAVNNTAIVLVAYFFPALNV
jgi:membrane protease YdiL (CAAX protease family)